MIKTKAGLLRVHPVLAAPGATEAMTALEVLDAVAARLAARRAKVAAR
jgi:hypothetical protein